MAEITVVGAGMMGSALVYPMSENGHKVNLAGTALDRDMIDACKKTGIHPKYGRAYDKNTVSFHYADEIRGLVEKSDLVVCGVNSFGIDYFAKEVLPFVRGGVPVVSLTKGLIDEGGDLIDYPTYMKNVSGTGTEICAIGGPCISGELVQHDHTVVALCGTNAETLKYIKSLIETPYYHLWLTTDLHGVEAAVALKNVYALGVSLSMGLFPPEADNGHLNPQAGLFGQSVREMTRLLMLLTGSAESLYVCASDLYVTVFGGRTRKIGTMLGAGLPAKEAKDTLKDLTLESLVIAERTALWLKKMTDKGVVETGDFPLLMHIYDILIGECAVNLPWKAFSK